MNNLPENHHIFFLKENMYKIKFLLVANFLFNKKQGINYKLLNILIFFFFKQERIVYSIFYQKYFIYSNDIEVKLLDDNIFVERINFPLMENNYKNECLILKKIYNELIEKNKDEIDLLYNKIF